MVAGNDILSQEDVDALLEGADAGAGSDGAPVSAAPEESHEKRSVTASGGRTDAEARELLSGLCRRAMIQRDRGVRVIWNAVGLFPLTPGYDMEIQGRNYITLGVLSNAHLVVGLTEA